MGHADVYLLHNLSVVRFVSMYMITLYFEHEIKTRLYMNILRFHDLGW